MSSLKYFYKNFTVSSFIWGIWEDGLQFQSIVMNEKSSCTIEFPSAWAPGTESQIIWRGGVGMMTGSVCTERVSGDHYDHKRPKSAKQLRRRWLPGALVWITVQFLVSPTRVLSLLQFSVPFLHFTHTQGRGKLGCANRVAENCPGSQVIVFK